MCYNYDCVLETVLQYSKVPFHVFVDPNEPRYHDGTLVYPPDESMTHIIKPHGSITFETLAPFRMGSSEPWRDNNVIENIALPGGNVRIEHEAIQCPMLPDIIPPGHDFQHLANPYYATFVKRSKEWLSNSVGVILCGLSAARPDTQEVNNLLGSIAGKCDTIHVGLGKSGSRISDEDNDAGILLRKHGASYRFLDVLDPSTCVEQIPELLFNPA